MKTRVFVIAILLTISSSLPAQPKGKANLDTIKFGDNLKQKLLSDRFKLEDRFGENNLPLPANSYHFQKQGKNLELVFNQHYNGDDMPIVKPDFKSNMPVMKPDSTTHYFIKIAGPVPKKH